MYFTAVKINNILKKGSKIVLRLLLFTMYLAYTKPT